MKIKILECSRGQQWWYAHRVGEIFEVEEQIFNNRVINYIVDGHKAIEPTDCIIVFEDKIETKSVKFKKVVKEIPNQEMMVTYNWLKEQNACQDAIDAFVNEFGNKSYYSDVYKKVYEIVTANSHENKFQANPSWLNWLETRLILLQNKDDVEYVTIDKIDFNNKFYIVYYNQNYYKIIKNDCFYIIGLNNLQMTKYHSFDMLYENNIGHIYEFDSFDDFITWYQQNKEIKK